MKNKKGLFCIFSGLLLIAAALFLTGYNVLDGARVQREANALTGQLQGKLEALARDRARIETEKEAILASVGESTSEAPIPAEDTPLYKLYPEMEMPVETIDGRDYIGLLEIPTLDLELPIISDLSYPALKVAPCRYVGSAYLDDLVIAAHNYQSHFGNLEDLKGGERVVFTDMEGNEFYYEVAYTEILEPTAIEEMTSGDSALTLFTCTLGGQNRVTVRCDRTK